MESLVAAEVQGRSMTLWARTLGVALSLAVLVAACQPSVQQPGATTTAAAAPKERVLRVGIAGYPQSLNANVDHLEAGFMVYKAIFEALTEADPSQGGRLRPQLATSWQLISDTTWQFKLRQDVKWSDGSPFTADDVVATINLVRTSTPPAVQLRRISDVTAAKAVDSLTVNIETKSKSAVLPVGLADIRMYQAKQIQSGGNDALRTSPVGTGKFMVAGRTDGIDYTLVRNPNYWGEKPNIDKVIFRAYPDTSTRVAALQSGEVDIAIKLPPDDAQRLKSAGFGIESLPIGQSMTVTMKMVNPNSPLSNKLVRQAVNYAINKQSIIQNLLLGFVTELPGQLVGSDGVGFNSNLKNYPYDPEKAKALLREAGYGTGFRLTFNISTQRWTKPKEVSEAIAADLRKVGVEVTIVDEDSSSWFTNSPKYDFTLAGWNYYPVMDADFALANFACASRFLIMCEKDFDELLARERAEADPQRRAAILQQMQSITNDRAPAIFLYQSPQIYGVGKRVSGFKATPDDVIHFGTWTVSG